jgi:Tol biopolymer transport system component
MSHKRLFHMILWSCTLLLVAAPALAAHSFSSWGPAASLESVPGTSSELNTTFLEGCPSLSRDGKQLYFVSNRSGGLGGADIWVAQRAGPGEPFGAPVNVGAPINSAYDDICPSPLWDGHGLIFVTSRPGGCGGADIYLTRWHPTRGWEEPVNLGCHVNSSANEAGPVLSFAEAAPPTLYFSSTRAGGFGGSDLYMSRMTGPWSFGHAELVPGVNSSSDDARPSIRHDGRELVFDSNRPEGSQGGFDIWSASRDSIANSWSAPANLGPNINSSANEIRSWISWEATELIFGSFRTGGDGSSDMYYSTRD